ncbi:MAG: hypothetical protein ACOC1K_04990, partial [Nanoarchaeota archaeon]
ITDAIILENNYHYEYKDLEISSLDVDTDFNITGNFILGSGSIDGYETDYYIIFGNFEKGLKKIKIDAYNTYINETCLEKPKIKNYYRKKVLDDFDSKWIIYNPYKEIIFQWEVNTEEKVLIVPENTIIKTFKVN